MDVEDVDIPLEFIDRVFLDVVEPEADIVASGGAETSGRVVSIDDSVATGLAGSLRIAAGKSWALLIARVTNILFDCLFVYCTMVSDKFIFP